MQQTRPCHGWRHVLRSITQRPRKGTAKRTEWYVKSNLQPCDDERTHVTPTITMSSQVESRQHHRPGIVGDGARLGAMLSDVGPPKTLAPAVPDTVCPKAPGGPSLKLGTGPNEYGSGFPGLSVFEKCWFNLNSEYSVKMTWRVSVIWL